MHYLGLKIFLNENIWLLVFAHGSEGGKSLLPESFWRKLQGWPIKVSSTRKAPPWPKVSSGMTQSKRNVQVHKGYTLKSQPLLCPQRVSDMRKPPRNKAKGYRWKWIRKFLQKSWTRDCMISSPKNSFYSQNRKLSQSPSKEFHYYCLSVIPVFAFFPFSEYEFLLCLPYFCSMVVSRNDRGRQNALIL